MKRQRSLRTVAVIVAITMTGCATTVPYVGQGPHPQIERGQPFFLVDALGNLLAIPGKILLWNWRFASHSVSPKTEDYPWGIWITTRMKPATRLSG